MSWRPIARTWRKPLVVTRAVRAPLSSRIMLVATVVPCRTRPSIVAARPASSKASRTPARKAWLGSAGTLGVLARQIWPLLASYRAMSVNVPPMSTATASDVSAKAVDISVAVESLGLRPLGPQLGGGGLVDNAVDEDDAIESLRGVCCHEAAGHVLGHHLGWPVEGMAMAAAAAGLDAQHVAMLQHVAVRQRRQHALVVGAGIDQHATGAARHAAIDAPRRVLDAVDAHGKHCFLSQDIVFAHDAAAAAIASGAAGIDQDAVGAQAHRIAGLEEFDGVVLLRHEVHGVGAVGIRPRAPADAYAVRHQERFELALVVAEGAAQEGDHVGRMRRRRLATGDVDQSVHC